MKYTFDANGSYTFEPSATRSQAVTVSGTWSSGTITVSVIDGYSGDAVVRETYTADFAQEVLVGRGKMLRLVLSGATSPELSAYVEDLHE